MARDYPSAAAADEAIAAAERVLRELASLGTSLHDLSALRRVSVAVMPTLAETVLPAGLRLLAADRCAPRAPAPWPCR